MVYLKQQRPEKVTVPAVRQSKERGEKLVCLTAYDYPTARIVDEAGTDIILVGDSLGNVVLGYDSTVPVTLEEMLHHTRAVRRGTERALLVADMPYGTYHTGADDAVRAALRLVKEGGAEAVKLEGGRARVETVRRLVEAEIPVMGHLGLTPQSLNKLGSSRLQARTADAARALVEDALMLEEAGAFAVVLEVVPREIAKLITEVNREDKVTVILVEQNSRMALKVSRRAYVLETGRVGLAGLSAELANDDHIRRLYLGG